MIVTRSDGRVLYTGQEERLRNHLLWFDTFLGRTTTVTEEDKERTRKKMKEFKTLLDESPFVKERVAEAEAEGKVEGKVEGLQEAVLTTVEARFPSLMELAQQKVTEITNPHTLKTLLRGINGASDEATARAFLELAR